MISRNVISLHPLLPLIPGRHKCLWLLSRTVLVLVLALAFPSVHWLSTPPPPPQLPDFTVCEKTGSRPACLLDSQSLGYWALAYTGLCHCEAVAPQICHLFFSPPPPLSPATQVPVSKAQSEVRFTICFIALRNNPVKFSLDSASKEQNRTTVYCLCQSCSVSAPSSHSWRPLVRSL